MSARRRTGCARAAWLAVEALESRRLLSAVSWTGAGNGTSWTDPNNWSTNQLPGSADDVTINLAGATISLASGTQAIHSLTVDDPTALTGGSLTVATSIQANAPLSMSGGTLSGATVTIATGGSFAPTGGTLDGVTVDGNWSVASNDAVTVTSGITLGGTLALGNGGSVGVLNFAGTGAQTLGGSGTVSFGAYDLYGAQGNANAVDTSGTLTIAPGVTVEGGVGVVGSGGYYGDGSTSATVVNQGAIEATTNGNTVWVDVGGTNTGTVSAAPGATLALSGTFGAAAGGTLALAGGGTVSFSGTERDETISVAPGTTANLSNTTLDAVTVAIASGGTANLDGATLSGGVTVDGAWSVTGDQTVTVTGGLTLGGTLALGDSGSVGVLNFTGTGGQTLSGSGTVTFGPYDLYGAEGNANAVDTSGTLTVGAGVTVEGGVGVVGSGGYFGDGSASATVVNQGTIEAGTSGNTVWVDVGGTNAGTVSAVSGATLALTGAFGAASGGDLPLVGGGTIAVSGTEQDETISVASGTTANLSNTTLDAVTVDIASGGTANLAGATLTGGAEVDGNWTIAGNNTVTVTGGLTLGGTLTLGDGSSVGVLNFTGTGAQTLGGSGTVAFGAYDLYGAEGNANAVDTSGTLTIAPGITVDGGVGVVGSGGYFGYGSTSATVVNQGTIEAGTSGDMVWVDVDGTNAGTVSAASGATLALTGAFGAASGGTLLLVGGGTITFSGTEQDETISVASGTTANLSYTTLDAATVAIASGGTANLAGATLTGGVTVDGNWTVAGNNTVTATGGLTLGGTLTLGDGGSVGVLNFTGSGAQTLGGQGAVAFGAYDLYGAQGNSNAVDTSGTLNIAPGVTIEGGTGVVGSGGYFGYGSTSATVVNYGTISATTSGNTMAVNVGGTNAGTVSAAPGATLALAGAFGAGAGGTLALAGGGTVSFSGTEQDETISVASGTTVNLTNTTLDAAAVAIASGGTANLAGATLAGGVEVDGAWSVAGDQTVTVTGGLTLGGTLSLGDANGVGVLDFTGTGGQTLGGSGTVAFGAYDPYGYSGNAGAVNMSGTLTVGPGVTIGGGFGVVGYGGWYGYGSSSATVVNQGTIEAGTSGETVTVDVGGTNAGTLSAAPGATLALSGAFRGAGDEALSIGGGGTVLFTGTANGGTIDFSAGTTYSLSGATLDAVTLDIAPGATVNWGGSTLDGATVDGAWSLSGQVVTVLDGLTLDGTLSLGDASTAAALDFSGAGPQTLGGQGTVTFGGFDPYGSSGNASSVDTSGTLTVGPGITIVGGNGVVGYGGWYGYGSSSATVVNQGTIEAGTSGETVTVDVGGTNAGTLTAVPGATLALTAGFAGAGTLSAGGGGTVTVGGTITGGTISVPAGTTYTFGGATLSGVTLDVAAGGTANLSSATVDGGTINIASGGTLAAGGSTLDGATVDGAWSLSGQVVTVLDGLTLDGTLSLGDASTAAALDFSGAGPQTLGGQGTVTFGGFDPYGSSGNASSVDTSGTLTVGPGITIVGGNGVVGYGGWYGYGSSSATVVNQGTIEAGTSGETVTVDVGGTNAGTLTAVPGATLALTAGFAGAGTLSAGGGGTVTVGGTITGGTISVPAGTTYTFGGATLSGVTLDVAAGGTANLSSATVDGGTINIASGGTLAAGGSTLDGVKVVGNWSLSQATVTVLDGLTLDGTLSLGDASTAAALDFSGAGPQTLGGQGTVTFGGFDPYGSSGNASSVDTSGTLTVGPGITIVGGNGVVGYGGWYGYGSSSATVVNQGTIEAGTSGETVTVDVGGTNAGTLTAVPGATLALTAGFAGAGTLSAGGGGTVTVGGTITGGTISVPAGTTYTFGGATLSGVTLDVAAGGTANLSSATVDGGTINIASGGTLAAGGSTLDGATVDGAWSLSDQAVTVLDGLTLDGTLSLGDGSGQAGLIFAGAGAQTLGGSGTVAFGAFDYNGYSGNASSVDTSGTLTVGPGITIVGGNGVVGNGGYYGGGSSSATLINQGTIEAGTSGQTVTVGAGSSGKVVFTDVLNDTGPGTLGINSPLELDGSGALSIPTSQSLTIPGSLTGSTTDVSLFKPLGTVTIGGSGTVVSPVLLEAMSNDEGAVAAGFVNNFAYGTLDLDGGYVQLVNQYHNTTSTAAEAVYAQAVIVPSGTTLDLNGLHLYARVAEVDGTVINGTISQLPNGGGSLAVGTPTPADIQTAGSADQWQFVGLAGQAVTVVVNPGTSVQPAALSPELNWVTATLADANGNVLATGSSTSAGGVVQLSSVPLPANGNYTITVRAAAGYSTSTGNYVVAAYNATTYTDPLNLNQTTAGQLASAYDTDQWTFSAAAGTQIQFKLLGTSTSALTFSLTGPGGYSAFTNATTGSDLITVPSAGTYTLTVQGRGGQGGAYSFAVDQTAVTPLALGSTYTGTVAGSGQAQLFAIPVAAANPMSIVLDDPNGSDHNELYVSFGEPPTRQTYQYGINSAGANQSLLIPSATVGTWYVLVYNESVTASPSTFSLVATSGEVLLTSATPGQSAATVTTNMTINGAGFNSGSVVTLVSSTGLVFGAASYTVNLPTQMSASFAAGTVPAGTYSVRVTQADGTSALLPNVLSMAAVGTPVLTTNLELPNPMTRHIAQTIYIDYANTGNAAMPAPLLILSATTPLGEQGALFTLDPALQGEGLWTDNTPVGFSQTIEVLASGATPGVLQPGESERIPVYYAGWLTSQWDFTDSTLNFSLQAIQADNSLPMNWTGQTYISGTLTNSYTLGTLEKITGSSATPAYGIIPWANGVAPTTAQINAEITNGTLPLYVGSSTATTTTVAALNAAPVPAGYDSESYSFAAADGGITSEAGIEQSVPTGITAQAWGVITSNLESSVGGTLGDYVQSLDNQASYLGKLGEDDTDVQSLFGFEVEQADNAISPLAPYLTSATDDTVATPGSLSLSFGRVYAESISGRDTMGSLGMGWSSSWATSAVANADGSVTINEPGDGQLTFEPDTRTYGAYFSPTGVTSTLSADGRGGYLLTAADGTETDYSASGQLNYMRDTDGNGIAAGYTNGLLTSLTATSGQNIKIGYNGAGLVSTVTDSDGQTVSYGYDPTDTYLTSVTSYTGQVTTYTYDTTGDAAQNGLTSIAIPGGTHQYFTYDALGRVASTYGDGGSSPESFGYVLGEVGTTDGTGDTSVLYYNENDQVAKSVDALGNPTYYGYDGNYNLSQVTDAAGQSETYSYNGAGEVTSSTDFLGNTTSFTYGGADNEMTSMTDANGNVTKYGYDADGDLLSTTYADGTSSSSTFSPLGEAKSFLNQNGQTTSYTYNAAGQVTQESFADGTSYTYTYDANGNLLSATDPTGTTTFTYAPTTEYLTEVQYPGGLYLKFTYNTAGQRTQMVDQTGFTTDYVYDSAGRLSQLTDGSGNVIVTYTYDADGRLSQKVNGNGTYTKYTYDADGNVLTLFNYAPGGAVNSSFVYTYNSLGLETTETTIDGEWTYGYDADGELTHAVFTPNATDPDGLTVQNEVYNYDAMGNRTSTVINGVTTAYTVNDMNEYTSVGGVAYSYDKDGNLLSDGMNTYRYNQLNELESVTTGGMSTAFGYDALGERVSVAAGGSSTGYVIDPANGVVIAAIGGNGSVQYEATYGLQLAALAIAGTRYTVDTDLVGSVVGLTGANAKVVNSYTYSPTGTVLASTESIAQPFTFEGGVGWHAAGSDYITITRAYNMTIGRFTAADPLGLHAPSLFAYAGNNPVSLIDPSGLDATSTFGNMIPPGTATAAPGLAAQQQLNSEIGNYWQPKVQGALTGIAVVAGVGAVVAVAVLAGPELAAAAIAYEGIGLLVGLAEGSLLGLVPDVASIWGGGHGRRCSDCWWTLAEEFGSQITQNFDSVADGIAADEAILEKALQDADDSISGFIAYVAQIIDPNALYGPTGYGSSSFVSSADSDVSLRDHV